MNRLGIRGYCDRPNVAPGDEISFHVSCDEPGSYDARLVRVVNGDLDPDGPGPKQTSVSSSIAGVYEGVTQRTQVGSYVEITDPDGRLTGTDGFALHAFVWATSPGACQGVVSRWSDRDGSGWVLMLEDGFLTARVGDGQTTQTVRSDKRLFVETWYSVVMNIDCQGGTLRLDQTVALNSVNSRFGRVVPLDSDTSVSASLDIKPAAPAVPVIVAGFTEAEGEPTWVVADYNGKIDAPKCFADPLGDTQIAQLAAGQTPDVPRLAHWDFAAGIARNGIPSDEVMDVSGNGLHGRCVNQPDRGMTGWNWTGREEHFIHCPEEYGALWFHADAIDDCRWPAAFNLTIPSDLDSGVYAVELEKGEHRDQIPFFVTPPKGRATAKVAVLMPTFSYLAYANTQVLQYVPGQVVMGIFATLNDRDLELGEAWREYGLSTYDSHSDGHGCQYSTWRRPILNMRPDYRHEFGAVWQFPADLHLIDWLEARGTAYDVITDHDLVEQGAGLLKRYKAVMTGTHPEYYSEGMLDAWEEYLVAGGRGMYMAANGFYWITTLHPQKPWLIEVRKGESGDQAWRARPGELYHSTTGERGGLWRNRARAPQKLWGTGYTAHGLDVSASYAQMPDARDPRLVWMMEGIDSDSMIGDFGLINGGAAGLEMDRIDYALGTPPNTMLIASSHGHSQNALLVPEEQYFVSPGIDGTQDARVRADIVYFTTPNGGAVFSVSSMAWCGSLSHDGYDNNVSQLTGNVLDRFASDEPLDEIN